MFLIVGLAFWWQGLCLDWPWVCQVIPHQPRKVLDVQVCAAMSGFEMLFQFVDFLLNISSCHLNCGLCRTLFSLATSKDLFLTLTLNHRIWACISVRFSSLGFTDLWICKVRYSACLRHFWSLFLSVLCANIFLFSYWGFSDMGVGSFYIVLKVTEAVLIF